MPDTITRSALLTKATESLDAASRLLEGNEPNKVDVANQHRLIAQGYAGAAGLVED